MVCALLTACGAAGGPEGGGDNLPNRGVIPYQKVSGQDEALPDFVIDPDEAVTPLDPSALVSGAQVDLFFAQENTDEDTSKIALATSSDAGENFTTPQIILESDAQGRKLGAPSVIAFAGRYLMVVEVGEEEGIALATSTDGVNFELRPVPLLFPEGDAEAGGIGGPSLVSVPGGFHLYYHARPADNGADEPVGASIMRATAGDDLLFERDGVILGPGTDCLDAAGEGTACWDAGGVEDPEVRVATMGSGRQVFRLVYTGLASVGGAETGVGFAASFDGDGWSRFEFNPIVGRTARERAPTNVRVGDVYRLYFTDRVTAQFGIGGAINAPENPTESF